MISKNRVLGGLLESVIDPLPSELRVSFGLRLCQGFSSRSLSTLQILMVSSLEPEASRRPSGDHATDHTESAWSLNVCVVWDVTASQTLTVLSLEPDASRRLSGDHITDTT